MKPLLVAVLLFPAIALAQPVFDTVAKLRDEYTNCVFSSVHAQIHAAPRIDPNVAVEQGFRACITEEQGIRAALASVQMSYEKTETGIAGMKLRIKRNIREIMTDPKGYLDRNPN
jgi:hypothetical protein